ncbi:molybdenum cofactor guanylyltransferase [Luteibacter sp. ME-Dv--P-043b]|uniref:molybdenum cofactor guanylyltransferase n=1 Tax=Luteibacter sp. ME-Dv--P-043b TaxID=3040291 RepID=UPI002556D93B|nr:molybdenum cofactor guanylyltransferase [Luteibacter sp. ME-Dv--P-043b]
MAPRPGGRPMILGLVLAGGLSSRMGRDKAALVIDGATLLQRAILALHAAGAAIVAVSGDRPGGIPDRWPRSGPVGGIASVVDHLPNGELLVVPVDMPHLGESLLAPLLASAGTHATSCWQGHPLPMRLRLDAMSRTALAELMTRPGRACSVAALQSRLGVAALPLDNAVTPRLVNCNTPDQWREATA